MNRLAFARGQRPRRVVVLVTVVELHKAISSLAHGHPIKGEHRHARRGELLGTLGLACELW